MHRLFVALRPPAATRAALIATMGGVDGARWQDDDQLHLTLRFIGEVETPQAEDVAAALAGIAAPPVDASIAGFGTFERRGRVDALWARIAPEAALAALHRKVDRALIAAGVAPDTRQFVPHVTLARFSRTDGDPVAVARWIAARGTIPAPAFGLAYLYLFESRLGHAGAAYEAIARWPLT